MTDPLLLWLDILTFGGIFIIWLELEDFKKLNDKIDTLLKNNNDVDYENEVRLKVVEDGR